MISPNEYSKRPNLKNFYKAVKLGRKEVVRVQRVDEVQGYIDLSKKDVNPKEHKIALDKYHRSKIVHSILIHIATDKKVGKLTSVAELYEKVVYPLNRKF